MIRPQKVILSSGLFPTPREVAEYIYRQHRLIVGYSREPCGIDSPIYFEPAFLVITEESQYHLIRHSDSRSFLNDYSTDPWSEFMGIPIAVRSSREKTNEEWYQVV